MMRRFFHTLLPTAALLAVVACTKDDNVGKTFDNNAISVESANLSFNDEPSTGQAVLKTSAPISAVRSSNDWCEASFSGNTVTVKVAQNYELVSRVAQVMVRAGADSLNLAVKQQGLATFTLDGGDLRELGATDTTFTLSYKHVEGLDVTVIPSANWIEATANKGTITVKVAANDGNAKRDGYIRVRSGVGKPSREARLNLSQEWNVEAQLKGSWTLSYFTALDTAKLTRQQVDCTFANDSVYIDYGADGKVAFRFGKKLQKPYSLLIYGSQRCGGKLKGATPFFFLSADATGHWTGRYEDAVVGGELLRNAQGKLTAKISGLLFNDSRLVFTSMNIFTFDNAPDKGIPSTQTGRHKYADYFFPIFIKK